MNAPSHYDGRPELRRFIFDRLGFVRAHAEVAQIEAEFGQDVALVYAVRRAAAQLEAAASICAQLMVENSRLKALEDRC